MKRQSIVFILLLLQVLMICIGCGSSEKSAESVQLAAVAQEAAAVTEEAAKTEEAAAAAPLLEDIPTADMSVTTEEGIAPVEDAVGVFEGLEDNHTAIFSFDGAETAFYFEDPAVQSVLYEAVIGSTYTLSYDYSESFGCRIYEITEY